MELNYRGVDIPATAGITLSLAFGGATFIMQEPQLLWGIVSIGALLLASPLNSMTSDICDEIGAVNHAGQRGGTGIRLIVGACMLLSAFCLFNVYKSPQQDIPQATIDDLLHMKFE